MLGTKPAPIPWILCGPGFPPDSTGLSVGSTAITLKLGFLGLMYRLTPVRVPPVPTPEIREVDLAVGVVPDFRTGRIKVNLWICGIVELPEDVAVWG